jgi:hypothetical protein
MFDDDGTTQIYKVRFKNLGLVWISGLKTSLKKPTQPSASPATCTCVR